MILNDLRANAYAKGAGEDSTKSKENPVVKPFVPKKITKESFVPTPLVKETVQNAVQTTPQPPKKSNKQTLDDSVEYLKKGGLLKVPVETPKVEGKDSVYRRVAKFLLIIGENEAAKILPHLTEAQIEKIIPEITSIRSVSKEESEVILAEFQGLLEDARKSGGVETAREILVKAYGREKADEMIKKSMPMEGKKPFDYLNEADSERIYILLKDENVGIQSLVLSHLNPQKAAKVINNMEEDEKKQVILRLAKMEPVSPEVLRRVDQAMHEKSLNQTSEKAENIDGRNALAMILKKMDTGAEANILKSLAEEDPDLSQDLRNRLFTIDDVINADDRFIQEKLREMDDKDICYLIAGKTQDFRDKILSNVSAGRRAEIRQEETINAPFRRADCDGVTARFMSVLRHAYEDGKLIIDGRNDDIYL